MKESLKYEPSDFDESGQMLIRNSSPKGSGDLHFAVTVAYKVGYAFVDGKSVVLLVSLADGLTSVLESNEELCGLLNADPVGYRPMNSEEIARILGEQGNRFAV